MQHTTRNIVLGLLMTLWAAGQLQAQNGLLEKGAAEMERLNFRKAIEYYQAAFRRAPGYAAAAGNARAYLGLRDMANAASWFEKALRYPEATPTLRSRYGRVLQAQGKQEAAALQFDTCALARPNVLHYAQLAEFARQAASPEADTAWQVTPLRINSRMSDFGPVIWQEGLLFGSERNNSVVGVTHTSQLSGGFLADLYFARGKDSLRFARPDLLPRGLNTVFHDGPACLNADSSGLIFARSRRVSARSAGGSDFWEVAFREGKWQTPERLAFSGPVGTYSDPFLLPGGTTLLFTADIPGGQGGLDLYRATLRNGQWSAPENLGPAINTAGNERSPFVHPDGQLWFASDGRPGFGRLDLYQASPRGDRWANPQHAGAPLNSHGDDYDLVFAADGSYGYFASNRARGGWDDDIYAFSFRETREIICVAQRENSYCYHLYEAGTPDPLPSTLYYRWQLGDGNSAESGTVDHCFPGPGDYHVKLEVIDSLTGEAVFAQASYVLEIRDEIQPFIEVPDSIQMGRSQVFSAERSYLPGFRKESYQWEFGDGSSGAGEVTEHTYGAPGDYEVNLRIEGVDSLSPERDYYCVTRSISVLRDAPAPPRPKPVVQPTPPHTPTVTAGNAYRIQLGSVPTGFDSLVQAYRNIPGVSVTRDGDTDRYLMPGEFTLEQAFAQLPKAREMGFPNPTILIFREGKLLPLQPFLDKWLPSDSVDQTIVKGVVVDRYDVPRHGTIVWENLTTGEVARETVTQPEDGGFMEALPKDVFYGYYVDLEGYYSISRNLDLRNYKGALVIVDTITVYAISEMVRDHLPVRINNLFFDFDSDQIRRESYRELFRLVRFLLEHPQMNIEIAGHTDDVGSPAYNQSLSQRRAAAVTRFLVLSGCNPDHIHARGYGESRPVIPNTTPQNRQQNRRVEFVILSEN